MIFKRGLIGWGALGCGALVGALVLCALAIGVGAAIIHQAAPDFMSDFGVTLTNNTGNDVSVDLEPCGVAGHCGFQRLSDGYLEPGQAVVLTAETGFDLMYRLNNASTGRAIGCLVLHYDQKVPDARANVTDAKPCPGDSRSGSP